MYKDMMLGVRLFIFILPKLFPKNTIKIAQPVGMSIDKILMALKTAR